MTQYQYGQEVNLDYISEPNVSNYQVGKQYTFITGSFGKWNKFVTTIISINNDNIEYIDPYNFDNDKFDQFSIFASQR